MIDDTQLARDQLDHAMRYAERTVTGLASIRDRSRSYLAMAGLALTVAAGLLHRDDVNRPGLVSVVAACAMTLLVFQAFLSWRLNRGADHFVLPTASEQLKSQADPYGEAVEFLEAVADSNFEVIGTQTRWLELQVGGFVTECLLLAGALLLAGL